MHGGDGAAALNSSLDVNGSVRVRLALHLGTQQKIDDNVDVDIAAVVLSVWMDADQDLVSGELLGEEPFT